MVGVKDMKFLSLLLIVESQTTSALDIIVWGFINFLNL